MKLQSPFIIGPDLRPALAIGKGFVSLEYAIRRNAEGRTVYRWRIYCGDGKKPLVGSDLRSGIQGGTLQAGFRDLLGFLGACAEAWDRTGLDPLTCSVEDECAKAGECSDLFPRRAAAFAVENSDAISLLSCELDECKTVLIEE